MKELPIRYMVQVYHNDRPLDVGDFAGFNTRDEAEAALPDALSLCCPEGSVFRRSYRAEVHAYYDDTQQTQTQEIV